MTQSGTLYTSFHKCWDKCMLQSGTLYTSFHKCRDKCTTQSEIIYTSFYKCWDKCTTQWGLWLKWNKAVWNPPSSLCNTIIVRLLAFILSWHTLLHDQLSSAGDCGCLPQLLSAAAELGSQWNVSWPHVLSCCLVKATSLENMLRGLVFLTTWAGWRRHQLQLSMHLIIQFVVMCTQSHRDNLLLSGH